MKKRILQYKDIQYTDTYNPEKIDNSSIRDIRYIVAPDGKEMFVVEKEINEDK